jgi:hypothetical protein
MDGVEADLKIRIFGRDQGEAEDLRRGLNADIGRKDFFEMASTWSGLDCRLVHALFAKLFGFSGAILA